MHFDTNVSVTPKGSAHVFDVSRLKSPDIAFWSAWDGATLMGVGALKHMSAREGEIKSMHTLKTARRSGVGSALLSHIMGEAKGMGLSRLLLETGSFDSSRRRGLYARHGFAECPPFEGYKRTPTAPSWRGISPITAWSCHE